jgi:KDO2-lipid IV(A) lauroyltransferase
VKKFYKRYIKYPIILALIQCLRLLVWLLPWKVTRRLFAQLAVIAFHLMKKERQKTMANLAIAFPSITESERYRMAKEVFYNLGFNAGELAIKLHVQDKKRFFSNVTVEGEENARQAFARGKGVLFIVPHLGCWEAMPKGFTMLGYPAGAVGKPLANRQLNALVMKERQRMGFTILPRGSGYKTILNFLKENNALGMLIDQDTKVKGVFVDFYGTPAYTPIGTAMLALDSDAAVFTMAYVPDGRHHYRLIIGEPIPIVRSENRTEDIRRNTENFHKAAETLIRAYPTQWVWMHRRWKTTPEKVARKRS